jgi:hypothetical protein
MRRLLFQPGEAAALASVNRQTLNSWRDRKQFFLAAEMESDARLAAEATLGIDLGGRVRGAVPWTFEDVLRLRAVKLLEQLGYSPTAALALMHHPWLREPIALCCYIDVGGAAARWEVHSQSQLASFLSRHNPATILDLVLLRAELRRAVAARFPVEQDDADAIEVDARPEDGMVAVTVGGTSHLLSPEDANTLAILLRHTLGQIAPKLQKQREEV